ncbi:MAG: phosphate ABC transporter ATP-binding protein [Pseudomonadota bacterium]
MLRSVSDGKGSGRNGASLEGVNALMRALGLGFRVGEHRILDRIDFAIPEGLTTVIMGANGAGKSTLLKLLHGLNTPTEGDIFWNGRALDKTALKKQAMVFQKPTLLRRSVRANIKFALSVRGISGHERAERVESALIRADLLDRATRPARVLSGGEQQRLAVAQALACEPEILFLDEPTASLDPQSAEAVEALVSDAKADGVTIVLVTHDAGQARRLGDRLLTLDSGRLTGASNMTEALAHQGRASSASKSGT